MIETNLDLVLALLGFALVAAVFFRLSSMPLLIGYLFVGIILGPNLFDLIKEKTGVAHLAEFGIVFLMFSIGLEFNLSKLASIWRTVIQWGGLQLVLSAILFAVFSYMFGFTIAQGLIFGTILGLSSTAILAKSLSDRMELQLPFGQIVLAVLLFQDLAVIPVIIILPALAGVEGDLISELGLAFFNATLILMIVLIFGQRLIRPWFRFIAKQKSSELFTLNVLFITLALAWCTDKFGLSLALGAFLAGILISETEFAEQVEQDINPYKNVLLGLFFVTVGMQLDLNVVFNNWLFIILVLLSVLMAKIIVVAVIGFLLKSDNRDTLRSALILSGTGEFGIVLLTQANQYAFFNTEHSQIILAILILSMIISPFVIEKREKIFHMFKGDRWLDDSVEVFRIAQESMRSSQQVLICGYGSSGQHLGRFLAGENVSYIALDLDATCVSESAAAGEPAVLGDARKKEILTAAGLRHVDVVIITYSSAKSVIATLEVVKKLRPNVYTIVRTQDHTDIEIFKNAGASEIMSDKYESSLSVGMETLKILGFSQDAAISRAQDVRHRQYSLFQGFFTGDLNQNSISDEESHLHAVEVQSGAWAIDRKLSDLELQHLGVIVTAMIRNGIRGPFPQPGTIIRQSDVIVLLGVESDLSSAEIRIIRGV